MVRLLQFKIVLLILCLLTTDLYSQQNRNANLQPIYAKKREFSIPFSILSVTNIAQTPTEIRLYVSLDEGERWQMAGRAFPQQNGFTFRARGDRKFWFALQTLNQAGKLYPANVVDSGMLVIVDTQKPVLKLSLSQDKTGEIIAQYSANDLNLALHTFKMSYQVGSNKKWNAVSITPAIGRQASQTLQDRVSWQVPPKNEKIAVYAQIADKAGNVISTQQVLTTTTLQKIKKQPLVNSQTTPNLEPRGSSFGKTGTQQNKISSNSLTVKPKVAQKWSATNLTEKPLEQSLAMRKSELLQQMNNEVIAAKAGPSKRSSMRQDSTSPQTTKQNNTPSKRPAFLPPGERPKIVRSKKFILDYDVHSVGSSGIRKVELWMTTDGGKTWKLLSTDNDRKSPIRAAVPDEGLYGLKMVIQNGSGLGGKKPTRGDLPELWIDVDETKPRAKIVDVKLQPQQISILWQAEDRKLSARPIALLFSHRPDGPWTTIASGLVNTGSYHWNLGSRLPGRIYFRLEVQDSAGNIGVDQTLRAVDVTVIDTQIPRSSLRSVRPVDRFSNRQKEFRFR